MRRCLIALVVSCAALTAGVASADPEVGVTRERDVFRVHAAALVAVDVKTAWQVLTDYNRLAEFVPGMRLSRVLSNAGEPLRVEQDGDVGVLFFNRAFRIILEIEERPFERLAFHGAGGDIKHMEGEWRLRAEGPSVRVEYDVQLEPDFWVPPLLGTALMRHDIKKNFEGVIKEMQKRYVISSGKIVAAPR